MLGRLPYRVPGKSRDQCRDREDFVQLVTQHGGQLPGKVGNYRIAKFPGTERILFKTNFSKAFKDKAPWSSWAEVHREKEREKTILIDPPGFLFAKQRILHRQLALQDLSFELYAVVLFVEGGP